MKLYWLERKAIDADYWQQKLEQADCSNMMAQPWYLDAVSDGNWCILTNENQSVWMPVAYRKKMGFEYTYMPPHTQQLGIMGEKSDEHTTATFIQALQKRFLWIDYKLPFNANAYLTSNFNTNRLNFIFPLPIKKQLFKKTAFNNIKRMQKSQLSLMKGNIDNVTKHFADTKGKQVGWSPVYEAAIKNIVNQGQKLNKVEVWEAFNQQNQSIAGIVIGYWKDTVYFIFSGQNSEGRKSGAITGLFLNVWEMAQNQYRYFDCLGSEDEGLKNFYEAFGGIPTNYLHLRINHLPFPIRLLKHF
jgi:hypothetical protein